MSINTFKALVIQNPIVTGVSARRLLAKSQDPSFESIRVDSLDRGLEILSHNDQSGSFDIMILDLELLGGQRWKVLHKLRIDYPSMAILALGKENQPEHAIKALKQGAQDYLATERLRSDILIESAVYAIQQTRGYDGDPASSQEPIRSMKLSWIIEEKLARARGPHLGYPETIKRSVDEWIDEAKGHGIKSVICMLANEELKIFYRDVPGGLLSYYEHNGFSVGHVSVADFCSPPLSPRQLRKTWKLYQNLPKPLLVHCRHGVARSGHAIDYIKRKQLSGSLVC